MTLQDAIREAARRGHEAGCNARLNMEDRDDEAPSWLSGEWAGESIPELLGDLLEAIPCETADDEDEAHDALCDAYESAADEAFYANA